MGAGFPSARKVSPENGCRMLQQAPAFYGGNMRRHTQNALTVQLAS